MAHSEDTGGAPDTEELYDTCHQAQQLLEKAATGLGQINADPQMVQAVGKMADILGKICDGLAKGLKEQAPEPAHTMDSAMAETMRERSAAREGSAPQPVQA